MIATTAALAGVQRRNIEHKPRPNHPVGCCARCNEQQPIAGRGLCDACWIAAKRDGTLADYAPRHRPLTDFVEDYRLLAGEGHNTGQIAERLNMTVTAVRDAIRRARGKGLIP